MSENEAQEQEQAPADSGFVYDDDTTEDAREQPAEVAEDTQEQEADDEAEDADDDVTFDPRQQKKLESIIAKNTYRYKSQIEAEQARAAQLEQQLQSIQSGQPAELAVDPQTGAPLVPDLPDPFEENFEQKMQERDNRLRELARWEAEQQAAARYELDNINRQAQSFVQRGEKMGLSQDDIQRAGQFVAQAVGNRVPILQKMLKDEMGPAITTYLERNPEHLQKMLEGDDYDAIDYLAQTVRPRAVKSSKRKTAPPPPPSATEKGGGMREERGLKGATYE